MFFKTLRDIARPHWFEIISVLKQSTGMPVRELAEALGMSYMGVKQHCVELEKRGYLDTWRRPKDVGRPEKAYRLTPKADVLFPQVGVEFSLELLDSIAGLYGRAAAEKLLFGVFQKQAERYQGRVNGADLAARAASFAKVRSSEGFLSSVEGEPGAGLRILEHHTPYTQVAERYPSVWRMEAGVFERVLGVPVERHEERASGLVRAEFRVLGGE